MHGHNNDTVAHLKSLTVVNGIAGRAGGFMETLPDVAMSRVLESINWREVAALRCTCNAVRDDVDRSLSSTSIVCSELSAAAAASSLAPNACSVKICIVPSQIAAARGHPTSLDSTELKIRYECTNCPTSFKVVTELLVCAWLGKTSECKQAAGFEATAQAHCWLPSSSQYWLQSLALDSQLQRLTLCRCSVDHWQALQTLRRLQSLKLYNVNVTGRGGYEDDDNNTGRCLMDCLAGLRHLTEIDIQQREYYCTQDSHLGKQNHDLVRGMCQLQRLQRVTVAGHRDLVMRTAQQVGCLPSLSTLALEALPGPGATPGLMELCHLLQRMQPGCSHLTTLDITGCDCLYDRDFATLSLLFPRLQQLQLHFNRHANIGVLGMQSGAAAGRSDNHNHHHPVLDMLQTLCLTSLGLTRVALPKDVVMAALKYTQLCRLDLSGNVHVDDTVVYQCCELPGLHHLAVACCPAVSDIGLAQLATKAPQLQYLDIHGCDQWVTDLGVARLRALTSLTYLDMSHCCRVSDQGIAGLLGVDCQHEIDGKQSTRQHVQDSPLKTMKISGCIKITDCGLEMISRHAPHVTTLALDGLISITSHGLLTLSSLTKLTILSAAWCSMSVRAACMTLAKAVLGNKQGSLCAVPHGMLQGSVIWECKHQSTNLAYQNTPAHQNDAVKPGDASKLYRQLHDDREHQTGDCCRASTNASCPGSSMLHVCVVPHTECHGFAPLDDPKPLLPKPCWWMHS